MGNLLWGHFNEKSDQRRKTYFYFSTMVFRHKLSFVNFLVLGVLSTSKAVSVSVFNPYPTAFPYVNGMVLHFYQQQETSTTKTVHKVINKGLKTYV